MKIETAQLYLYELPFAKNQMRSGAFLCLESQENIVGWGEVAPLPNWSRETLEEACSQFGVKEREIKAIEWTVHNCFSQLSQLNLLSSLAFGLESALLSILDPLPDHSVPVSALLMGTVEEILEQAQLRHKEGYTSAKLKVSNLTFGDAARVIHALKDLFRLRIDVNRAWNTPDSLRFFAQFSLDTFDYVEEPFQNPKDLGQFLHPLAVDESFPTDLTLEQLENLPTLKALIYKPTMQGGMTACRPLAAWAASKAVSIVLSSSFESDLGLAYVASMAHRLSLTAPVGLGTYHYLHQWVCTPPLQFADAVVHVPSRTAFIGIDGSSSTRSCSPAKTTGTPLAK